MTPASNNTVAHGHNVLLAQEKGQLIWINWIWREKVPGTQHRTLAKRPKELKTELGRLSWMGCGPDCADVSHEQCDLSYGVLCC